MNTPNKNSPTDQTKNKKYAFVQKQGEDFTCIKILEGKFKGIIYKYGKVGFAKDENPDGTLPMKFDYDIIFNPHETNIDKQEFIDYIGDILIEVLEKQIENGTAIFNK
tara:strand:- start:10772 stop:11095 length:324 start_codon:yes stop_codon:yes gene_type:complete